MKHIILSDEQARILAEQDGEVELRTANGEVLGYASCGFTRQEIDDILRLRDSDGPYYTTEQVLAHLISLGAE